jgi:hypothetical protein
MLLVVGFLLGPLKMLTGSWLSYVVPDGLAGLALLVVVLERIVTRKPLFARSAITVPLVFLAVYCLLEFFNPEAPVIRSLLGLRSWLLYTAFYFVGLYTFRDARQLQRLYIVLLVLGLITGLYGVYQWRVGPQAFASWSGYYGRYAQLTWLAKSGGVFRAFSTFILPNTFGANMALLMMIVFGVISSSDTAYRWRMAAAAAFLVMAVGIVASGSRGPVAHLLIAAVALLAIVRGASSKLRLAATAMLVSSAAVVLIALVIGPVVTQRYSTIFDPQAFFWKWFGPLTEGVRLASEHPFGMGLGYTAGVPQFVADPFFRNLPSENVDSGYGSAAAELGLLGMLLFAYLAIKVAVEGLRAWKTLPPGRLKDLFIGPLLMAVTYPILSVVSQPQATLPSSIYFWLLIGMLVRASTLYGEGYATRVLGSEMHSRE